MKPWYTSDMVWHVTSFLVAVVLGIALGILGAVIMFIVPAILFILLEAR